jgi:hypothetical protein
MGVVADRLFGDTKILQPDRCGDVFGESLVEVAAGFALIDRAQRIEVPIVVQKIMSGLDRAARRGTVRCVTAVGRLVIDAGSRHQQVADSGLPLARQQSTHVVEIHVRQRTVEPDFSAGDGWTIEHGNKALPGRGDIAGAGQIAIFEQAIAAL